MWIAITVSAFLVILSGLFAGLTLGLLSLDLVGLRIISQGGEAKEREYASKLIPLRKRGNLLLCTLLLGNTAVNSAISILLSEVSSGLVGLVVSTSVILVLGEILPQAVCSRHSLYIGSRLVWVVTAFMILFWPITAPLAFFLDKMLGRDIGTVYSQDELKRLIEIHVQDPDAQKESGLTATDQRLLLGIFEYKDKSVKDVMTKVADAFMLENTVRLTFQTLSKIYISGCSRIPIYDGERSNIVGILFVKDLILVDPDDEMEVSTVMAFRGRNVSRVYEDVMLDKVFTKIMACSRHMLIAHAAPPEDMEAEGPIGHTPVTGLITLEDVLEEMIKSEIYDESDEAEEILSRRKREAHPHRQDVSIYLNLFEHKMRGLRLSPPEVQAVFAFLAVNLEEFRTLISSEVAFKGLIKTSVILERAADGASGSLAAAGAPAPLGSTPQRPPGIEESQGDRFWDSLLRENGNTANIVTAGSGGGGVAGSCPPAEGVQGMCLYERGVASPYFTLILQGKVLIRTGAEGFELDVGAWSHLGNKALTTEQYAPDFDAAAVPPYRLLRIHRASYLAATLQRQGDSSLTATCDRQPVRGAKTVKSQLRLASSDAPPPTTSTLQRLRDLPHLMDPLIDITAADGRPAAQPGPLHARHDAGRDAPAALEPHQRTGLSQPQWGDARAGTPAVLTGEGLREAVPSPAPPRSPSQRVLTQGGSFQRGASYLAGPAQLLQPAPVLNPLFAQQPAETLPWQQQLEVQMVHQRHQQQQQQQESYQQLSHQQLQQQQLFDMQQQQQFDMQQQQQFDTQQHQQQGFMRSEQYGLQAAAGTGEHSAQPPAFWVGQVHASQSHQQLPALQPRLSPDPRYPLQLDTTSAHPLDSNHHRSYAYGPQPFAVSGSGDSSPYLQQALSAYGPPPQQPQLQQHRPPLGPSLSSRQLPQTPTPSSPSPMPPPDPSLQRSFSMANGVQGVGYAPAPPAGSLVSPLRSYTQLQFQQLQLHQQQLQQQHFQQRDAWTTQSELQWAVTQHQAAAMQQRQQPGVCDTHQHQHPPTPRSDPQQESRGEEEYPHTHPPGGLRPCQPGGAAIAAPRIHLQRLHACCRPAAHTPAVPKPVPIQGKGPAAAHPTAAGPQELATHARSTL
ncbi:MAG: hypothetical protein WDW38_010202 [Sanguina aurantia]